MQTDEYDQRRTCQTDRRSDGKRCSLNTRSALREHVQPDRQLFDARSEKDAAVAERIAQIYWMSLPLLLELGGERQKAMIEEILML